MNARRITEAVLAVWLVALAIWTVIELQRLDPAMQTQIELAIAWVVTAPLLAISRLLSRKD